MCKNLRNNGVAINDVIFSKITSLEIYAVASTNKYRITCQDDWNFNSISNKLVVCLNSIPGYSVCKNFIESDFSSNVAVVGNTIDMKNKYTKRFWKTTYTITEFIDGISDLINHIFKNIAFVYDLKMKDVNDHKKDYKSFVDEFKTIMTQLENDGKY